MIDKENKQEQINQKLGAILAFCIVPLLWAVVYLTNNGQGSAVGLYLIAVCIYGCAFFTIKAFPFSSRHPDRLLLRFFLFLCLGFTFIAVSVYEPSIPILQEAVAIAGIVFLVIVSYRPSLVSSKSKMSRPQQEKDKQ
ncbi:MAG: hypothetical protein ACOYYU_13740 [Chloroflexota bacterium]